MLLDCRSLTEMFRTPVGNFRSILLASGVLFSKSAAFHTQKPRAVVPKTWCSVSLKLNWSRKSSPSRILPLHHSTWPDSNSLLEASWQFRPFLLLPVGWSSTGTLFSKNWKEEFFVKMILGIIKNFLFTLQSEDGNVWTVLICAGVENVTLSVHYHCAV